MTPGVRSFLVGMLVGAVACLVFVTYYGDLGGDFLIKMGLKMKSATHTVLEPKLAKEMNRRAP